MIARLSAILLLAAGLASGWFALAGNYTALMNPAFRGVTIVGAAIVTLMGVVLLFARTGGSLSALVIFGAFFAVVAVARPHAGDVTPLLVAPEGQPLVDREGYPRLESRALFQTMDEETEGVAPGPVAMRGFVKRLDSLDARREFILLEPLMACCLADAVALGVRVRLDEGALPEDGTWMQVFGDLELLQTPRQLPSFRVGAILFTQVSHKHRLLAHEVISSESLLENLYEKTPESRCALFRRLARESGLARTLESDGPFTAFAPLDVAFDRIPPEEREALFADPPRLREFLEDLIVRGRFRKRDLYGLEALETLGGRTLSVTVENEKLRVGGARVLFGDQVARNGILHVVHPLPKASAEGR